MTTKKERQPAGIERENHPGKYFDLFREVSGGDFKTVREAENFFKSLPSLGDDEFEAAKIIRQYLIDNGFKYDDHVFTLQKMMRERSGNCLGLSLLIGAILGKKGFSPEYQIILHPKDAIDKEDQRLFLELLKGEHFDYQNPPLPDRQAEHPIYRFAPLEHPSLILGGKRFETTGLDEPEEDPGWSPDAELIRSVSFKEVASNVSVDRAKFLINRGRARSEEVTRLVAQATELWRDNREAWSLLWEIAKGTGDHSLEEHAKAAYTRIGGADSRFYFNHYRMTGDEKSLDRALKEFPSYLDPFFEKNVVREPRQDEAKFNFAVASWCATNSSVYNLKQFYIQHQDQLTRLFGKDEFVSLIKKLS